jgi:cytidylate kinase
MIITIDGPAGTGKSSVAQAVAAALGFSFLDTGAMYRAIAVEVLRRQTSLEDQRELAFVAKHCRLVFDWSKQPPALSLNGEPVGHLLRDERVTPAASLVAQVPAIRSQLVAQQREIAQSCDNLVSEGRDQGSVVFPDALLKVYLDAEAQERARRRVVQLRHRGENADYVQVLEQIQLRDRRDASRAIGPLSVPTGAHLIDTTRLTQDQVVQQIVSLATSKGRT